MCYAKRKIILHKFEIHFNRAKSVKRGSDSCKFCVPLPTGMPATCFLFEKGDRNPPPGAEKRGSKPTPRPWKKFPKSRFLSTIG